MLQRKRNIYLSRITFRIGMTACNRYFLLSAICLVVCFANIYPVQCSQGVPRTVEEVLEEWTVPAISALSLYETGDVAQYGKIATDFDCQGLSMGILQWTINSGGIYQLFDKIDNELIKQLMGDSYGEFQSFLTLLREGHNRSNYNAVIELVRQWQDPPFDDAAFMACSNSRARGPITFKPEKSLLLRKISALLEAPPLRERQNALAREKARCVYYVAKAWRQRIELGRAAFAAPFKTCNDALKIADKSNADIPTKDHPGFREFLVFYDIVVQVGVGSISSIMDVAALIPVEASEPSASNRILDGRLYNDFRTALGWLSTCWDWRESGTACKEVEGFSTSEKYTYVKDMSARKDALSRRERGVFAVLSNHIEALRNAEVWGAFLDVWQQESDKARLAGLPYDDTFRDRTEQVRLGMVSFITSLLSYRNYSINVMNRKGTLVFGHGCSIGKKFNFREFYSAVERGDSQWLAALRAADRGSCLS